MYIHVIICIFLQALVACMVLLIEGCLAHFANLGRKFDIFYFPYSNSLKLSKCPQQIKLPVQPTRAHRYSKLPSNIETMVAWFGPLPPKSAISQTCKSRKLGLTC